MWMCWGFYVFSQGFTITFPIFDLNSVKSGYLTRSDVHFLHFYAFY
ncbi:hypothetical protein ROD_41841 [Citrobacter rodentium ICC168]|uniref:Uncharacterized protein n=1 Tax=Citrobacter rodentium (strain ICC168) TaxID=637910 RepID=D2TIX0_CITRI|nr:hypothetical protein ROD_41841 [Citrobacter rodentium ICC168]